VNEYDNSLHPECNRHTLQTIITHQCEYYHTDIVHILTVTHFIPSLFVYIWQMVDLSRMIIQLSWLSGFVTEQVFAVLLEAAFWAGTFWAFIIKTTYKSDTTLDASVP
jgi:hypothetical protein